MQRIEIDVRTGQRSVVELTPGEVAAAQARTAVDRTKQRILALEAPTGFTRRQREWLIAHSDGALLAALESVEAGIAAERAKLG